MKTENHNKSLSSLSIYFRNEANDYEPDESAPLSPQEDVEKASQKPANLSFGDRCMAFKKPQIYSAYAAKVCLATLTTLLLVIWDSVSDYLVSIKHFR